jgi:hypothetical protein
MIVVGSDTETPDNLTLESMINENKKPDDPANDELRIFCFNGAKLIPVINLTAENGHNSSVKDVAWAPLCGRVYHKIGNFS